MAVLAIGLFLGASSLFAQETISVTGTVMDQQKVPIPGAAVIQAGTTVGTSTDKDGQFTINVPKGSVLEVSSIGFTTQKLKAAEKMTIVLVEDSKLLDETIVVGYGTQKKASLTSAITNIKSEDIISTKQADLVSSLQGKVPGLMIRQNSGNVGWFDQELSLRGYGAPLVIIDGVARQSRSIKYWGWVEDNSSSSAALAELNPDDIESITVLKDASASIYGIGAQNGVILVTTKKGQIGKPSINYSNTLTYGVPTALPEEVDIAKYMELENEMRINHRQSPRFTADDIAHYRNHDPGYEDFSWYDAVMKNHSFSQVHNVSVRGGNQQTQYYLSGNLTDQGSIYRTDTGDYHRYGFTGNFTTKLTPSLSLTFQSAVNVTDQEMPPANTTQNAIYYGLLADRTIHATTKDNPNHYSDLSMSEHRNPVALMNSDVAGSNKSNSVTFRNNLDLKYEAPFLKGLSLQGSLAYDLVDRSTRSLTKHFPVYDYETGKRTAYNPDENQFSENWSNMIKYYGRFQANYNQTFKNVHHVGATFAMEATLNKSKNINAARRYGDFFTHDIINQGDASTATNGGSRSSSANAGYVGRINYDYKGKYLVEVMARYDGTYLYASGHRWGFFPSYSLGWRVSDEPFFKAILPKINNFKLRWSDGKTGQAQGKPYAYLPGYTSTTSYVFDDGGMLSGYANHSPAQTLISWADVRMMDFGFDFEGWKGLIGGSVDWFWRRTSGIADASSATVPDFYGISLPQMNLNDSENVGIDLVLTHHYHIKDFNYRVSFSATFARYRMTHLKSEDTAVYSSAADYYAKHTEGRWSDARSASTYHWLGGHPQFSGWADIDDSKVLYSNSSSQNDLLPGMYKIEDRNGDGIIDGNDVYYDWSWKNPPLQFGLIISGNYKRFDFNMTFNAATLTNKNVSLSGGMGYGFFRTFYKNYLDRWKLADGYTDPFDPQSKWEKGYWPAISSATAAYDSYSNATYRYNQPYTFVNGTYLRLKSVEVGYTFSSAMLRKAKIRSLRVYVNGTNLLTFCNKLLKPYDPERDQSSYLGVAGTPLMKNFSAGVNLNF